MTELTIQVPDELAQRLEPLRDRLPELLQRLVETVSPRISLPNQISLVTSQTDASIAYTEVLDFLITSPTPQEITTFKVSAAAQARLRTLLDKNREGTLTEAEATELDLYEQLEHLMILLKAKAYALIG